MMDFYDIDTYGTWTPEDDLRFEKPNQLIPVGGYTDHTKRVAACIAKINKLRGNEVAAPNRAMMAGPAISRIAAEYGLTFEYVVKILKGLA